MCDEITTEDWLSLLSAAVDHHVMYKWIHMREYFFEQYLVIDDDEFLIVADKRNFATYEFAKVAESFVIEFKKKKDKKSKKLFGFGKIEVLRNE